MSQIARSLERLPFGRFHYKLLLMGGLGYMFEAVDAAIIPATAIAANRLCKTSFPATGTAVNRFCTSLFPQAASDNASLTDIGCRGSEILPA